MTSILAGLRQEKKKFWIGTAVAALALTVSVHNKSVQPTAEAPAD